MSFSARTCALFRAAAHGATATKDFAVTATKLANEWRDTALYTAFAAAAFEQKSLVMFFALASAREFTRYALMQRSATRDTKHLSERAGFLLEREKFVTGSESSDYEPSDPIKLEGSMVIAQAHRNPERHRLADSAGAAGFGLISITNFLLAQHSLSMDITSSAPNIPPIVLPAIMGLLCVKDAGGPVKIVRDYGRELFNAPRKTGEHPNQTDKFVAGIKRIFNSNAPQAG